MPRLFCNISTANDYESKFRFIKGALNAKTNGDALEKMIDRLLPVVKKEINSKKNK